MTTRARKDYRAEIDAWLEGVKAEHAADDVLDAYADLWLANEDAKAIKDPGSPAAEDKHAEINAALSALGL